MEEINTLIANYLQKSGSNLSASEVAERMNELGNQIGYYQFEGGEESIFSYGEEATEGELYAFLESVCSNIDDYDQFADDVNLLFNILDTSGDGILTDDELELFQRTGGEAIGEVTDYKFNQKLALAVDAEEIQTKLDSLNEIEAIETEETETASSADLAVSNSDDETEAANLTTLTADEIVAIADKIANGEESLDDYTDILSYNQYLELSNAVDNAIANLGDSVDAAEEAEDTEEASEAEESEEVAVTVETETEAAEEENEAEYTVSDFSDKSYAKSFVETFLDDTLNTPGKVINWLLENGVVTEEESQQLQAAYISYTDKDQEQIDALMSTGLSYDEAVKILEDAGKIESESSLDSIAEQTISEDTAQIYAKELFDSMDGLGTDNEQFNSIMNNENLTSADWVKIIYAYNNNEEYDSSFIQDVDGDFSFLSGKSDKMTKIAEMLVEEAENGNETAIELICEEFYNGTAGMELRTAEEFISAIFDSASDELLSQIVKNYSVYNEDRDIFTDIKSNFSSDTEDNYIARLNEALSNS